MSILKSDRVCQEWCKGFGNAPQSILDDGSTNPNFLSTFFDFVPEGVELKDVECNLDNLYFVSYKVAYKFNGINDKFFADCSKETGNSSCKLLSSQYFMEEL